MQPHYFAEIKSFLNDIVPSQSEKSPSATPTPTVATEALSNEDEKAAPVSSSASVASSVMDSGDDGGSFEMIEDEEELDAAEMRVSAEKGKL